MSTRCQFTIAGGIVLMTPPPEPEVWLSRVTMTVERMAEQLGGRVQSA